MPEFIELAKKYDSRGKFRNEFLAKTSRQLKSGRASGTLGTKAATPHPTVPAATLLHHLASSFLDNSSLRSLSAKSGAASFEEGHVAHISPSKLLNCPARLYLLRGKIFTFFAISANYEKECLCV
jgi:hypothetical protein